MTDFDFPSWNFTQQSYNGTAIRLYYETLKSKEFRDVLGHSKETFKGKLDLVFFLETNPGVNLYLTAGDQDFVFKEVSGGFLIGLEAFYGFQSKIRGSKGQKVDAFLKQKSNIHNSTYSEAEKIEFISSNTTEENISDIINLLSPEKQKSILSFLKIKLGELGEFDFKSNVEGIFLEIGKIENRDIVIKQLRQLERNGFQNIENALSISKIDQVLEIWQQNTENKSEEFWQNLFETHNWVLSQLFSAPTIFIKGKPYCGGKSPENSGGVMSDLWYKNLFTGISTFIEIKTPKTDIIGSKYRGKEEGENNVIYGMSNELTGGIIQVSNQREVAISEFGKSGEIKIHNAKSLLIIGNIPKDEDQKKSFSLFRNSNKDVEIITFDELLEKIKLLKKIYE